jgi:predicted aspartyl protease
MAGLGLLNRRGLAATLGLMLTPGLARAGTFLPPLGDAAPDEPPQADADIGLGRDRVDRLTIPVMVGDQGPFRFVVDTGADRSVIAADIAASLGHPAGPTMLIHGIAGSEMTPTIRTPPLQVGSITLKTGAIPVLSRQRLGADGMLGVDVLQSRRLVMDIRGRTLKIRRSGEFEVVTAGEEMVVRALKRYGRLAVVDASTEGVDVTSFIDSGAELSVGNMALAARMGLTGTSGADDPTRLYGVTEKPAFGFVHRVRDLKLGGVNFTDVPLVFCDLHLFDLWGLNTRPSVLLGMDVLQLFSRVELDYGSRQMRFRLASEAPLPAMQVAQS